MNFHKNQAYVLFWQVTIKKISLEMREKEEERDGIGGGGRNGHHNGNNLDHAETETIATGAFREGLTNTRHIEKVYLTGVYRDKYRWVSNVLQARLCFRFGSI